MTTTSKAGHLSEAVQLDHLVADAEGVADRAGQLAGKTMITRAIASNIRNTAVSANRSGHARQTGRRSTPQISAEARKKQPM